MPGRKLGLREGSFSLLRGLLRGMRALGSNSFISLFLLFLAFTCEPGEVLCEPLCTGASRCWYLLRPPEAASPAVPTAQA